MIPVVFRILNGTKLLHYLFTDLRVNIYQPELKPWETALHRIIKRAFQDRVLALVDPEKCLEKMMKESVGLKKNRRAIAGAGADTGAGENGDEGENVMKAQTLT